MNIRSVEGMLLGQYYRFAIVATRFNDFIVLRLIEGAQDTLIRHGVSESNISVIRVPGAFELPLTCKKVAELKTFDAIIALGAVIRGATPHFEYVANEVTKGIASVSLKTGIPISFGVLTTDSLEQAIERAGTKAGNKGSEAALAAIESVNLFHALDEYEIKK